LEEARCRHCIDTLGGTGYFSPTCSPVGFVVIMPAAFGAVPALLSLSSNTAPTTARPDAYLIGTAGFLLICLIGWIFYEGERSRRAHTLIRATRRIASGDFDVPVGVKGKDDFALLGSAIGQMAQQLRLRTNILRERQDWFRMLLENGSDIILTLDRSWLIGFASPSLPHVLGWTPDQIARKPLEEFLHPGDVDAVRVALAVTVRRSGFGQPIAFRFRHADGGWRSLEATGNHPRDWPGKEHIILTARDITARERLEGQLRQAQKMEALGRFAGGVAHDFNNLLTAIQGYTSLLMNDVGPADPRREDLEEIRKASERAAALTRQILAFSRRQVADPEPVNLNGVIREMERLLPRLIGEDIVLESALDPGLDAVHADPRQLEQVIINLVLNARDAMPHGGRLLVQTANEFLNENDSRVGPDLPPGPYIRLTVSDSGTGIEHDIQGKIFDPFFTTKAPGQGTGLGLATVYGIVKQSGGHIGVESAPQRGATFQIHLPRIEGLHLDQSPRLCLQPGPRGSETILLVEDEEAVRLFANKALEKQGYTVLEARHGRDALDRLAEHSGPVHLVITDIVMPEMGGSELALQMAREHPEVPILFLSGYSDGELTVRGLGQGGAFLPKPFTSDGLARKVREVLG
jgi:two-component system cell cycle sensor histidine kinase/response regulator CckA